MNKLAGFSDDELLEEILRRRNKRDHKETETKWCDDCENFKPWTEPTGRQQRGGVGLSDIPVDYNPCRKGNKMSFHIPEDYDDPFGFYRRVCPDRLESSSVVSESP